LRDRSLELATWARDWYLKHGAPLVRTRHVDAGVDGAVTLDGVPFLSRRLLRLFTDAGAHGAIVAAMTAGPELEAEAQRLWLEGKPDEYFFLEMYGSAVVEHLVTMTGARWCAWADPQGLAILPHDSPGYPEWPIEDQAKLWGLLGDPGPEGPGLRNGGPDLRVGPVASSRSSSPAAAAESLLAVRRHAPCRSRATAHRPDSV
jgi:hypothetical protein